MTKTRWHRYRFLTKSVYDYRPLKFNPKYPYWCTGYGEDYVTIVSYLPECEDLKEYWDDAYQIDCEIYDEVVFSDRFPKPEWYQEGE